MTKYPFSPAGFQELQQVLYALPDEALDLEAGQILTGFSDWMNVHFELLPSQIAFISNINAKARNFIAFQTSFAVGNRLPVSLIKTKHNDVGTGENPDDGKIIRPKSKLSVTSDNEGGFEADGQLDIEIFYLS